MDRDNEAGRRKMRKTNSGVPVKSQSSEISNRPSVIGWLCCYTYRDKYRCFLKRSLLQSGFVPLAIFRDRLTALLYAYSISTPQKQENREFRLFIEDGTNGFEDPPALDGPQAAGVTQDERAYVERLEAKVSEVLDFHYEGLDGDPIPYQDKDRSYFLNDVVLVFPLEVMNPPMDTISPHVRLTVTILNFSNLIRPASGGIVINICEGCNAREYSRNIKHQNSRLVCECEVEYFPFGIPFLTDSECAKRLSTCLAENYPNVSSIKQIPADLARHVVSLFPLELILNFLQLPGKPRNANTEKGLKKQITFSMPKRVATTLDKKTSAHRLRWPEYDEKFVLERNEDFWEADARVLGLEYAVNYIPENANWSSLGLFVIDDSEDSAVQKAVSFLRNRIPSKYLSEGSKCVVQLLVMNQSRSYSGIEHYLKLEFFIVNGVKHCAWFLFNHRPYFEPGREFKPECAGFLLNSTVVYLKDSSSNIGDVVINNLASYLVTAYERSIDIDCEINRDEVSISSSAAPLPDTELSLKQRLAPHFQNIEFLLNKIRMDVNNNTLRQLWTKIATLFQISNFSFINHQDQTTPVNTPTDLVVLTDYIQYEDLILNSALATAYRNNSGCLKTFQSFDVNVAVVICIRKSGKGSKGGLRISRYRLKMSRDHMCEIFSPGMPGGLARVYYTFPTCLF